MDLIQSELCNFDFICITESWLDGRTADDDIKNENFKPFRRDGSGDHHGGICVDIRITIFSKRRYDLKLPNIECLWAEISIKNKIKLIGTFYRPPKSTNAILSTKTTQ